MTTHDLFVCMLCSCKKGMVDIAKIIKQEMPFTQGVAFSTKYNKFLLLHSTATSKNIPVQMGPSHLQ